MSSLSFLTSLFFFDANLRILDKTAELQRSFFPLASREKFCRKKKAAYICSAQSPDGGIGRRTGLKIQRPQGCAGSTPAPGTAFSDLAIFLARSFCFPASYNLPPGPPGTIPTTNLFPPRADKGRKDSILLLPLLHPSRYKKAGGLFRPPAKVNSRTIDYYR